MLKMMKQSKLLKQSVVRILLFGIPFGLSYLATRPDPPVPANRNLVVCAYPTDRPGEFRFSLDSTKCKDAARLESREPARTRPARRIIPADSANRIDEASISF